MLLPSSEYQAAIKQLEDIKPCVIKAINSKPQDTEWIGSPEYIKYNEATTVWFAESYPLLKHLEVALSCALATEHINSTK